MHKTQYVHYGHYNGSMSTLEPTLRELRRERSRSEIASTALALFQEHGYEATTVEQIASAALVSPRTFYNYFPSKEDVLFFEVDATVEPFHTQVLAARRSVGPYQAVRAACLAVADHLDSQAEAYLPRLRLIAQVPALEARDRQTDKAYVDAIASAVSTTTGRSRSARHRARLTAAATVGGLNEAIDIWVDGEGRPTLHSLITELFDVLRPTYTN